MMDRKRRKLTLEKVIAELKQVKEEQARSELESKIDIYKEQCTELQSENEKLQRENERLQKYVQDLESANINVEEKSQINLYNTDMNSQITKVIAELKQVKEEQARSELESKIDIYKEQCTELQSENEKLQRENERLQKYVQDLESANINVEEKSQINLYNTDMNSQITKFMNNRYTQSPIMNPPPGISRDYAYGSYLHALNNPYPLSTSLYPASFNSHYPKSFPYPASCNSPYPSSVSPYPASSIKYYPASGSPYPASSTNCYPTSSNSPHHAPTLAYPCSSNRHYPATNSSYSGPTSMNQPPGASPYPLMRSRCYDSRFGPSVNESNDDAVGINSLPDEIIEEIFGYLKQNKLGQIARVCRRWNVLTKSPVLWRKVNVKIFSSDTEKNAVTKSFINGLPSCATFIRLDFAELAFSEWEDLISIDFEELCTKLHQKCPHVEELILARCAISNILPEVINFCTRFLQCVKKLMFHYCGFPNHSRTVELNDNSKIEVLDVYCSHLKHFSKTQFSKLLYLKELRLNFTAVNDNWFVDNASFFNQLHVLDLGITRITASTFLAIQNHSQNLKELYLCKLNLRYHDLNFNKSVFPQLKSICVSCYHITCEGVVSLIQSCPSLQNVYVSERVARSFATHPFVLTNRCKSGIVKVIHPIHRHNIDYLHT